MIEEHRSPMVPAPFWLKLLSALSEPLAFFSFVLSPLCWLKLAVCVVMQKSQSSQDGAIKDTMKDGATALTCWRA